MRFYWPVAEMDEGTEQEKRLKELASIFERGYIPDTDEPCVIVYEHSFNTYSYLDKTKTSSCTWVFEPIRDILIGDEYQYGCYSDDSFGKKYAMFNMHFEDILHRKLGPFGKGKYDDDVNEREMFAVYPESELPEKYREIYKMSEVTSL